MPIDKLANAINAANDEVFSSYAPLIKGSDAVANHVAEQLREWQATTAAALEEEFPFLANEQRLAEWEAHIQPQSISRAELAEAIDEYVVFCKAAGYPANESFWQNQLETGAVGKKSGKKPQADLSVSARLLLSEWQKSMDKARSEWELEKIQTLRAQLMERLEAFLKLLQQLQSQMEALGLDPGILLDLSKGNLSAQDIQSFQRWAKYLAEDEGVRSLCELLGKVRQIELSEKIERVRVTNTRDIQLPDINSREEIIGIRLGRDLEHALPSELALLSDPDTAVLFDLKYVESRLMCFDMQGIQTLQEHVEAEEERQTHEEEKQGPMVICVDTSGSMSGMPETIAKAVALFMAAKAREQERPCYLINFSTGVETLDLANGLGMESLIDFLKMSFHGGTDVAPALRHALQVMQKDAYQKADLLIISDFIMAGLPADMLECIEAQRGNGNRFYSLVVGSCYMTQRLKSLFDHEWVYDPRTSCIHELIGFQQRINGEGETFS